VLYTSLDHDLSNKQCTLATHLLAGASLAAYSPEASGSKAHLSGNVVINNYASNPCLGTVFVIDRWKIDLLSFTKYFESLDKLASLGLIIREGISSFSVT